MDFRHGRLQTLQRAALGLSAQTEQAQSPFGQRPGAVLGPWGVPSAYGNPLSEQRVLLSGSALVDLSHRGVITVTGPDRLSWLDSLLSQQLATLAPHESAETLLLDPQGHIQHAMRIVDDGETSWLFVDEDRAPALAAWLDKMRFMKQVEVADLSDTYATIGVWGESLDLPGALITWVDPWPDTLSGGWRYATTDSSNPWEYREILIPRTELAALAATDIPAVGLDALDALRVAAWRPRVVTECDEKSLPHESDWLRTAVHMNKGCYRGQETVAKVHNLGHPPRRLVFVSLDGVENVLPAPGDVVQVEGSEVGVITSAARHHEEGLIALALVKRSVSPDAQLEVLSESVVIPGTQVVIVPTDAGKSANVPRIPRLGAVKRPVPSEQ